MPDGNSSCAAAAADAIRVASSMSGGLELLAQNMAQAAAGQLDRSALDRELLKFFFGVPELAAKLQQLPSDVRELVSAFCSGDTPNLQDFRLPPSPAMATVRSLLSAAQPCPEIIEG